MGTPQNPDLNSTEADAVERERFEALQQLENWLETPMLVLAFVWLALLIVELTWGESVWFNIFGAIIWGIFLLDFVAELALAPRKLTYLKRNWLTAISLLIPALRIFRIFRVVRLLRMARAGRGLQLLRVVSSLNRGMHALSASLSRRGFGYVVTLTVLVTLAGAAGMYAFEKEVVGGLKGYGEALWWTAMIMTTMGSQYWPQTAEGRVLCLFLALYAFAVFGYVTAMLATYFIGRDAENDAAELAGAKQLAELQNEVNALREEIRALSGRLK
ncbi:potassium channel family protein [Nitrosomonas sp. Nm166]|uniref:potassium channel family protein n=1 Tax=Nitrosomonas sp. Nm166 TaxID=1881054 RepID=UPI001C43294E|nr:potassium channel family protein [Nitrosomonas sp. Nm166]